MTDIILAIVGIALVLFGADKLTDGSVGLARRFSIPEMVIGLTVVAFGTSLPEFVVSLMSALQGSADMSIGNIIGSNLFNTLMIVGITAAIAPIAVRKSTIYKDIPFTILASVVLIALAADHALDSATPQDLLTRSDGIALLGFFAVFMAYTFAIANPSPQTTEALMENSSAPGMPVWKVALFIVGGLVGLVLGGELFVRGASSIARSLGVSDAVVGLTLVAGGTSLPELATSVVAARKGNGGIAIGNVIGSNLFNIFWILGFCSTITPMHVTGIRTVDFVMLLVSALLFWFFAKTQRTILRWEGVVLVAVYVGYLAWLISNV